MGVDEDLLDGGDGVTILAGVNRPAAWVNPANRDTVNKMSPCQILLVPVCLFMSVSL